MDTINYIIENGEPVEAQHGDVPTHVLISIKELNELTDEVGYVQKAAVANLVETHSPQPLISFEEFWEHYPRRVGKKMALKLWLRMSDEQRRQATAVIDAHTQMWIAEGRGTRTIPHASTWLSQERWEDEVGFVAERSTSPVNNRGTRSKTVLDEMEGR